MKTGLVLEGGAMRGIFTAGVLDVLMDAGIHTDLAVGVSAGALFGVNFYSRQKGRVLRYCSRFNKDPHYMGLLPFLKEGNLMDTEYAYHKVPFELDVFNDEAFQKYPGEFYAVATEVKTGRPVYLKVDSVFEQMDILRASGSMPFVSRPVQIGQYEYLDGGISDCVPVRWMQSQNVDKQIVILTQPYGYRKKPMNPALCRILRKTMPGTAQKLADRHIQYNRTMDLIDAMEKDGCLFVIRPEKKIEVAKLEKDPEKLRMNYEMGARITRRRLQELKDWLDQSADQ